jgi:predicted TIM-barrel fold metal-dependent hydrolase
MHGDWREGFRRELDRIDIIDAHEHIKPEPERLKLPVDVFSLFDHYSQQDLANSGMADEERKALFDPSQPVEARWRRFEPHWRQIRHTSYSQAVLRTIRELYGFADLDARTCTPLSAAMAANNTPGLYQRLLHDRCRIRTVLTQCDMALLPEPGDRLLRKLESLHFLHHGALTYADFAEPKPALARYFPRSTNSIDEYLDSLTQAYRQMRADGLVGVKTRSCPAPSPGAIPDRQEAERLFRQLEQDRTLRLPARNALRYYLQDAALGLAAAEGFVIAVHTGYWGDFRELSPSHLLPLLDRHPEARFDVYHAGYPEVREALMLGKGHANVWLNFCWTHIISSRFAVAALDEAVDLVPANKILAFGGDYNTPAMDTIFGHLEMAKDDVAEVLCRRIAAGQFDAEEGLRLARLWFHDNAATLYGLTETKR